MSTFLDDTQKVSCTHDCLPTNASTSAKVGWDFLGTPSRLADGLRSVGPFAGEMAIGRVGIVHLSLSGVMTSVPYRFCLTKWLKSS